MHRTSSRVLLIVAAFVLFLVPVAAIAAGGFDDVADDNVFKADIAWLADAGVTKGCNPPANTEFCPGNAVTREQMAAFMHRLAVKKVVDAATAVTASNANDADKLDGMDSSEFVQKGETSIAGTVVVDDFRLAGGPATRLVSLTDFDVPANGGVIAASAAGYALYGDGHGTLWIEIDGSGACDQSRTDTLGFGSYETVSFWRGLVGANNATEVAAGSHDIDLCAVFFATGPVTLTARMNVVWSAVSAGVAG